MSDKIECDDGNLLDYDGCDSNCEIEENYECILNETTKMSICFDNRTLTFKLWKTPLTTNTYQIAFNKNISDLTSKIIIKTI